MCLWYVSLAGDSGSPIGHPAVTFDGAPNFDVATAWTLPIWDRSYLFNTKTSGVLCLIS